MDMCLINGASGSSPEHSRSISRDTHFGSRCEAAFTEPGRARLCEPLRLNLTRKKINPSAVAPMIASAMTDLHKVDSI